MPRTKEENAKVRERTTQTLLKAAVKVFSKKGYHASTMEEIAKTAGVSKGLAYHYFKSKEDLLVSLAKERIEEFAPLTEALEEIPDPNDRLQFLIDFFFRELQERPEVHRFYGALYLHADGVRAISKASKKYKAHFERQLLAEDTLMKDLGFAHPSLEATLLRSTLQGIGLEYLLGPDDFPLDEMKNLLLARYKA